MDEETILSFTQIGGSTGKALSSMKKAVVSIITGTTSIVILNLKNMSLQAVTVLSFMSVNVATIMNQMKSNIDNIVEAGNIPVIFTIDVIKTLAKKGSLITYNGRNNLTDMQIQSFNHSYPNTVFGGCDFEMTLRQVRIAHSSYKVPKSSSGSKTVVKTTTTPKTASIKVGDIVIFTGGNVYVSSTAAGPAANRGKSTCKVTIINSNKHPYHLISTDGGKVYGWVDKANVQAKTGTTTQPAAFKSTKQVTNGDKNAVYHAVKKGNTVWGLVNNNYKSLGKSVQWVIDNNPKCFSKKGDPTTLIIGSKLLMGYKT